MLKKIVIDTAVLIAAQEGEAGRCGMSRPPPQAKLPINEKIRHHALGWLGVS